MKFMSTNSTQYPSPPNSQRMWEDHRQTSICHEIGTKFELYAVNVRVSDRWHHFVINGPDNEEVSSGGVAVEDDFSN